MPMKLFTLFTSDAAAVEQSQRDARRIARVRERLRGRAEWGVRMRRQDEPVDLPSPPRAAARPRVPEAQGAGARVRAATPRRPARAERAFQALRKLAAAAVRKDVPENAGRLLLDAVFLVTARRRSTSGARSRPRRARWRGAGVDSS